MFNDTQVVPVEIKDVANWPYVPVIDEILSFNIPGFTLKDWEIWNVTTERLMEYNKPLRVQQAEHNVKLTEWMKQQRAAEGFIRSSWILQLSEQLPTRDPAYSDKSDSSKQQAYLNLLMVTVFLSTFFIAVICVVLFAIGLCVTEDVLPTERSGASDAIATIMQVVSGTAIHFAKRQDQQILKLSN